MSDPSGEPVPITIHPFAELLPDMSDGEREALEIDIKENGLIDDIITNSKRQIIDGRHRYRSCIALGIKPRFLVRDMSEVEVLSFVLSRNLKRRHLTAGQRAAIADKAAQLRQGQNQGDANLHLLTQQQAAVLMNTSVRAVKSARKAREASPDLAASMLAGKIAPHAAENIVKLSEPERAEAIKQIVAAPNKKEARAKAKAAASSHAKKTSRAPSRSGSSQDIHAAYAALFEELDQLPRLLDQHPLSGEHLEQLIVDLRAALEVAVQMRGSQLAQRDDGVSGADANAEEVPANG